MRTQQSLLALWSQQPLKIRLIEQLIQRFAHSQSHWHTSVQQPTSHGESLFTIPVLLRVSACIAPLDKQNAT
jgi:hypothetical protein